MHCIPCVLYFHLSSHCTVSLPACLPACRVVERLLDLLTLLCRHDENRALCAQKGLAGVLDLAVKMNKKSPSIAAKAASLLAVL